MSVQEQDDHHDRASAARDSSFLTSRHASSECAFLRAIYTDYSSAWTMPGDAVAGGEGAHWQV